MAPADELDDEAVARLLAEDARASSSRYASQGLSALLPRRANGSAPKPNTRFLKNLVRDADSHNAALRRKEEQERRERLRQLDNRGKRRDTRQRETIVDREDVQGRKRRRLDGRENEDEHGKPRRRERSHKHRRRNTSSGSPRSRSPSRVRDNHAQREHSYRDREVLNCREDDRRTHRKHHRRRTRSPNHSPKANPSMEECPEMRSRADLGQIPPRSDSSDPLENLVGSLPISNRGASSPIRSRGRGAHKISGSVMDSHFSASYDPALDVHPDSEDSAEKEDWDMALEALRDRQQWKRKQADRMREAGFGDAEIKKWEESGKEKSSGDLKWRKAGEAREWDVGKSAASEGETYGRLSRKADSDLEASWKRKSGTLLRDLKSALR